MFTGIVQELGAVEAIDAGMSGARIRIAAGLARELGEGDSVAVEGCCLTVSSLGDGHFEADVMNQTLSLTTLGALEPGDTVNLEPPLRAGEPLGGHIVQGHVDGVGQVVSRTPSEHWEVVEISMPATLAKYVVDKGSITVDGVSLTVVEAGEDRFTVSLIPETLTRTTLGHRRSGDRVNLETDVIAKHVEKLLSSGHLEKLVQPPGARP